MGCVINDFNLYWPAPIPYQIDSGVFPVGSAARKAVEDAIAQWNQSAAVQLVQRTTEPDYIRFVGKDANAGCSAGVGNDHSGAHELGCDPAWKYVPAIMHEIGHWVGLYHEQQRPDRDTYVAVSAAAVEKNAYDYAIAEESYMVGPYDCVSIMHYGAVPGFLDLKAGGCSSIGKATGLTSGDRATIRFMYPTTEVWSGKWTKGWTSFMPFVLNGKPYHLAYKQGSGEVDIDRIKADGKGVDTIWEDTWDKGWTSFMPFVLNGKPHYLAYKRGSGEVDIDRIKPDGKGVDTIWEDTWDKGWTSFVPFVLNGRRHYLAYKQGSGEVDIDRIKADGKGVETIWEDTWTKGWTSFVPFVATGRPHYLAYKRGSGEVDIDRIKADGKGVETIWEDTWTKEWTTMIALRAAKLQAALSYKSNGGRLDVDQFADDGKGTTLIGRTRWKGGWTGFAAFELDKVLYILKYNRASGTVAIDRVNQ